MALDERLDAGAGAEGTDGDAPGIFGAGAEGTDGDAPGIFGVDAEGTDGAAPGIGGVLVVDNGDTPDTGLLEIIPGDTRAAAVRPPSNACLAVLFSG